MSTVEQTTSRTPGPGIIRRNILSTLECDHVLDNERCEVREAEAFKTDSHRLDPYLSAIGCCPATRSAGGIRRRSCDASGVLLRIVSLRTSSEISRQGLV